MRSLSPLIGAAYVSASVAGMFAQAGPDTTVKFDVVSVKQCDPNGPPPSRSNGFVATPGRLRVSCQPLYQLRSTAYLINANGQLIPLGSRASLAPSRISSDLPDWWRTDRFTVEATTDQVPPPLVTVMQGPMLQTILEDRFKLKVHRETREVPVDELVVAKGGAKLTPFKPGSCVLYDLTVSPQPPLQSGQHRCANGETPFQQAMKDQIGLERRSGTGPHEFVIIDHAEHPTPD